jgi:hypothetical protein
VTVKVATLFVDSSRPSTQRMVDGSKMQYYKLFVDIPYPPIRSPSYLAFPSPIFGIYSVEKLPCSETKLRRLHERPVSVVFLLQFELVCELSFYFISYTG